MNLEVGIFGPQNACIRHMRNREMTTQLKKSMKQNECLEKSSFCSVGDMFFVP
jgi:hypothetical protein